LENIVTWFALIASSMKAADASIAAGVDDLPPMLKKLRKRVWVGGLQRDSLHGADNITNKK
jgi:hypothetical protein